MSLLCPSPRQLQEMELGCPGTLLPLGIPDPWASLTPGLRSIHTGSWYEVLTFPIPLQEAKSLLESSPTVYWQVIKQHFYSKMVEQLDRLG